MCDASTSYLWVCGTSKVDAAVTAPLCVTLWMAELIELLIDITPPQKSHHSQIIASLLSRLAPPCCSHTLCLGPRGAQGVRVPARLTRGMAESLPGVYLPARRLDALERLLTQFCWQHNAPPPRWSSTLRLDEQRLQWFMVEVVVPTGEPPAAEKAYTGSRWHMSQLPARLSALENAAHALGLLPSVQHHQPAGCAAPPHRRCTARSAALS